jgi:putative nucleotidyltransferase with HDIG domain
MHNLKNKIADFVRIRTIPPVLNALLSELADDHSNIDSVSKIISQDISLTARLLRVANSAYYKRQTEIRTVNQAISVLGTRAVKALALSVSFFDLTGGLEYSGAINLRDFWRHNLEVAVLSSQIASDMPALQPEEAFTCGLLHDLGMVFFIQMMPDEYRQVLMQAANTDLLEKTEIKILGASHSEIGAEIASAWRLPNIFRDSISNHHLAEIQNSADGSISIWQTVNLAHKYSRQGIDICPYISIENLRARQAILDRLNIKPEKIAAITSRVQEKVISMAAYLDIDIGDPWNLLSRANAELGELYDLYEKVIIDNGRLQSEIERNTEKRITAESMGAILQSFGQMVKSCNEAIKNNLRTIQALLFAAEPASENQEKAARSLEAIRETINAINAIVDEFRQPGELQPPLNGSNSSIGEINQKIKARMECLARYSNTLKTYSPTGKKITAPEEPFSSSS